MCYAYDICPRCFDELYIRQQINSKGEFGKRSGSICPKCGVELVLACVGNQKEDNTMYKIFFESMHSYVKREQCIESIMIISDCNIETAIHKLNNRNTLLCEAGFVKTYLYMEMLDDVGISYKVAPSFPYTRYVYAKMFFCPKCGNETSEKNEKADDSHNHVKHGFFCNNCNEWITYCYINELALDDTIYILSLYLDELDNNNKEEIVKMLKEFSDNKIENGRIIIKNEASVIYEIIQRIESANISYIVEPTFPYEVNKNREVNENFLDEILSLQDE